MIDSGPGGLAIYKWTLHSALNSLAVRCVRLAKEVADGNTDEATNERYSRLVAAVSAKLGRVAEDLRKELGRAAAREKRR